MSKIKAKAKMGIVGFIKSVIAAGTSRLAISIGIAHALVFGIYNGLLPNFTAGHMLVESFALAGTLKDPMTGGFFALTVIMTIGLGYMMWTAYDVIGKIGIIAVGIILGSLAAWAWTMGAFDGMGTIGIISLVQSGIATIVGFGYVAAGIHRAGSGQGNLSGDVGIEE